MVMSKKLDVRNQPESWKTDLDQQHQCKHYLYRGEAIFYGTYSVRRPKSKFFQFSQNFPNFFRGRNL